MEETDKIPVVSIGLPVYNGAQFIREALDSLLAQTFTNFELIISDNASTDETEMICKEYASKDSRIRYIRQSTNIGVIPNFRYVLDQAKGLFFMWAAHDDRWHPEFISLTKRALYANPDADLAFTGMEVKNLNNGDSYRVSIGFNPQDRKPSLRYYFRLNKACPNLIYGLFRTAFAKKLNLKNFDFFDIYIGLFTELNSWIVVVPFYLYTAGTNGNRIPYSIEGGKFISYKIFVQEIFKLLKSRLSWQTALFLFLLTWYWIIVVAKNANKDIRKSYRVDP